MSRIRPRACVITGFGINADEELVLALRMAGAEAAGIHVSDLIDNPSMVGSFRILAFPGGFSFGDHLGSGMVFAHLFRRHLKPALEGFIASGGLVIGICNGFQVLVKMGVLPNMAGAWEPEVSLVHNDSGRFEDRWVRVAFQPDSPCLWTRGLAAMDLPVRHGEGKLVVKSDSVLDELERRRLVALRYAARFVTQPADAPVGAQAPGMSAVAYPDDPNGSVRNIAGICDPTGRVFGLMPHPEAFVRPENHPEWTRGGVRKGQGLAIFENGVRAARDRA
jgi:phosphoribosylformylglycinamidine (FGAM) synthase-like amidotransferase family enzyme